MTASTLHLVMALLTPAEIVRRIGYAETRMDHKAIGDGGNSRGAYQMGEAAWTDVNQRRYITGRKAFMDWKECAHIPAWAEVYATSYYHILCARFRRATKRLPNLAETYALWNLGFEGFRRIGFNLSRVPATTKAGIARMRR